MRNICRRKDRTARLLKEQILLWQHPNGLKIDEIAKKCGISERTLYRDLKALETELQVPIWEDGNKRGVEEGYFLPPINFSQSEAVTVFLSARLMQNLSPECKPEIISVFTKLGAIVPSPLRVHIQSTVEYLERQPKEERRIRNFENITRAWLSQHRVKFKYQELSNEEPTEHLIDPLFVEPSMHGSRSIYVIAYCHLNKTVRSFNLDQIVGYVTIEPEAFEIPPDFNPFDYLGTVMSIYSDEKVETIKLHFKERICKAIVNTYWHPSQKIEVCQDGTVLLTLKVRNTVYFRGWLLGLVDDVEVLEPESLRNQIANTVRELADIYLKEKITSQA